MEKSGSSHMTWSMVLHEPGSSTTGFGTDFDGDIVGDLVSTGSVATGTF